MRHVLLSLVALVLAATVAQADSLNCRLVGSWPFGYSYAVAVDSARNLAFIGSGGGVYVLDISNPAAPVKLSEAIRPGGTVHGLCYDSSKLYVAAEAGGLEIWDVSVPASPALLGRLADPGRAHGVAVAGSF